MPLLIGGSHLLAFARRRTSKNQKEGRFSLNLGIKKKRSLLASIGFSNGNDQKDKAKCGE